MVNLQSQTASIVWSAIIYFLLLLKTLKRVIATHTYTHSQSDNEINMENVMQSQQRNEKKKHARQYIDK